ncbi:NAD kinase [Periweissella cryptocerci]|uniref:NAD kinase n=1 Tax=Periweissella cryptocerci TaxID=2506420 RepID=A0A4V1AIF3_9LACO|nr:NAD kinase [Periweissella cryptocerci]QBO35305.1 NAD kinase [Periweissella cryptocerci]
MKVGLHGNSSQESIRVRNRLEKLLLDQHITIDNLEPDIVISVGGDGSLLGAFQKYRFQLDRVRFVGLHTGHLGFYTDWREYEINELVDSLVHDTAQKVEYPLLAGKIHFADDDSVADILALNESTVKKVSGTMVADVYLGGELFERFRGDGLSVSTPTGSTAYNKAIGGAVLHPRLEALQLAEMASINNQVFRTLGSPLVIASDETIRIVPEDSVNLMVMYDQQVVAERPVKEIEYHVAKEKIAFAEYRHNEFWHRVNESFIGRIED